MPQLDAEELRASKRRRIRKGTTSCWQCKKRKTRCQFASPTDDVCVSCDRRKTVCLSQEFPEDAGTGTKGRGTHRGVDERLRRTEVLIERLMGGAPSTVSQNRDPSIDVLNAASGGGNQASTARGSPSRQGVEMGLIVLDNEDAGDHYLSNLFDPFSTRIHDSYGSSMETKYYQTSRELHALLPCQRDADIIIGAGHTTAFLQFFTVPYGDLFRGAMKPTHILSALPGPMAHPVLLARSLLYLANGLQQLHPSGPEANGLSSGSTLQEMIIRYFGAATANVTSNEQLIQSVEGLECLILEGVYHINSGNLRPAWLCFRRCINLAQLMGLHRRTLDELTILDSESMSSPSLMWYRIMHQDRYLSLMLGVPAGTSSNYHNSDQLLQGDCATGRLECMHSVIMGRIALRNDISDSNDEFALTKEIDLTLQKAARTLPSHWWVLPSVRSKNKDEHSREQLEDIMRTLVQLTHFNLLVLLHLPHMLREQDAQRQQYSKIACTNASRELLNRYTRFRSMYQAAFCCRSIDYAAFTACLTLLLAHLESHQHDAETVGFLAHQRLSDRAMVEETVELMLGASCSGTDSVSQQTASTLRRLSDIEAGSSESTADLCCIQPTRTGECNNHLYLTIPSFGRVNISSNGITQVAPRQPTRDMSSNEGNPTYDNGSPSLQLANHSRSPLLEVVERAALEDRGVQDNGPTALHPNGTSTDFHTEFSINDTWDIQDINDNGNGLPGDTSILLDVDNCIFDLDTFLTGP